MADARIDDIERNLSLTTKYLADFVSASFDNLSVTVSKNTFVSVDDFGAVGDGKTDCTEAIQKALDTKNSITFNKGTYLISDTLTTKASAQIINLNGAHIVWNGAVNFTGSMFVIKSSCALCNGMLYCANDILTKRVYTGVTCLGYNPMVYNLGITRISGDGIHLGNADNTGSMSCKIHNVQFSGNGTDLWSLPGGATGIYFGAWDNKITNCVFLRCNKSLYFKHTGANLISNCHICAIFRDPITGNNLATSDYHLYFDELPDSYAVYMDNNSNHQQCCFVNCYFDNHKYLFYNAASNSNGTINLTNCFAWAFGDVGNLKVDRYILGGRYAPVTTSNCSIASNRQVFDAAISAASNGGQRIQDFDSESYDKVAWPSTYQTKIYIARNRVKNRQYVRIVRPGFTPFTKDNKVLFGGLVIPDTALANLIKFPKTQLCLFVEGGASITCTLQRSGSSLGADVVYDSNTTKFATVYVGTAQAITVLSVTSILIPFYIENNTTANDYTVFAYFESFGTILKYLANYGNSFAQSSSSYVTSFRV